MLRFLLRRNLSGQCLVSRSYTCDGNKFTLFKNEGLKNRPDNEYYNQVEAKKSAGKSAHDASDLHDITLEGRKVPGVFEQIEDKSK